MDVVSRAPNTGDRRYWSRSQAGVLLMEKPTGQELSCLGLVWKVILAFGMLLCLLELMLVLSLPQDKVPSNRVVLKIVDWSMPHLDSETSSRVSEGRSKILNTFGSPRLTVWLLTLLALGFGLHNHLKKMIEEGMAHSKRNIEFFKKVDRFDDETKPPSHHTLIVIQGILAIAFILDLFYFLFQAYGLGLYLLGEPSGSTPKQLFPLTVGAALCVFLMLSSEEDIMPRRYVAGSDLIPQETHCIVEVPRGTFCFVVDAQSKSRDANLYVNTFYKAYYERVYAFQSALVIDEKGAEEHYNYRNYSLTAYVRNIRVTENPENIDVNKIIEPSSFFHEDHKCFALHDKNSIVQWCISSADESIRQIMSTAQEDVHTILGKSCAVYPAVDVLLDQISVNDLLDSLKRAIEDKIRPRCSAHGGLYTYSIKINISTSEHYERIIDKLLSEVRGQNEFARSVTMQLLGKPELLLAEGYIENLGSILGKIHPLLDQPRDAIESPGSVKPIDSPEEGKTDIGGELG